MFNQKKYLRNLRTWGSYGELHHKQKIYFDKGRIKADEMNFFGFPPKKHENPYPQIFANVKPGNK